CIPATTPAGPRAGAGFRTGRRRRPGRGPAAKSPPPARHRRNIAGPARSSGQPQGTQPAAGLGPGLVQLALGDAVDDDAGTGAQLQFAPVQPGAADQDVEVEVAAAVEVAEGTGVGAAALAFQLGD